jgi:hypothetical protein
MYLFPGQLDRGLGKDCLASAVKLAHDDYGLAVDGINVNQPINEQLINIYFFNPNDSPQFQQFRGQCVCLGFKNIILCDAEYLSQFQEVPLLEQELDKYLKKKATF